MPEKIQEKVQSHRDLIVWKKSIDLSLDIYKLTEKFPKEEIYGLTSQMRRASISIASNIAEGRNRGTRKDYCQFLRISYGSCAELETQIEISKRLPFGKGLDYTKINSDIIEISKILNVIIRKLSYNIDGQ